MSAQLAEASNQTTAATNAPQWKGFSLKRLEVLKPEWNLLDFQNYSVYRSLTQHRFCFGLPTGSGKTLCSYASFFYFLTKFPETKLLIFTNKSAVLQFASEVDKFFEHKLKVQPVYDQMAGSGPYAQRRHAAYERWDMDPGSFGGLDVLVLNYGSLIKDGERLIRLTESLRKRGHHVMLICDEATRFSNIKTVTHTRIHQLQRYVSKAIVATATITKGKLEQIYGIFRGMGVQVYPTKEQFMQAHCILSGQNKRANLLNTDGPKSYRPDTILGYKNFPEFINRIAPYLIVLRKSDISDSLPAFTRQRIPIGHSEDQLRYIKQIYAGAIDLDKISPREEEELAPSSLLLDDGVESDLVTLPEETSLDGKSSAKLIDRLTEHAFIKGCLLDTRCLVDRWDTQEKELSPKTQYLINAVHEDFTDEKIVVYTHSKRYLKHLHQVFTTKLVPEAYRKPLMISGEVGALDREKNKNAFQETKDHNIIFINDAGSESINLQSSGVLVMMSMPRSGGDLIQIAGRISRIGTKHNNLLILFPYMEGSQEEDEYLILNQQMQVMASIAGEAERNLIDWEVLKESDKEYEAQMKQLREQAKKGNLEAQEQLKVLEDPNTFTKKGLGSLMLHKRKKRADLYFSNKIPLHTSGD